MDATQHVLNLPHPVDLTDWLKIEAGKLEPGQVLKSPYFLYLDAMSALEVMVKKTDSGLTTEDDLKLPRLDQTFVESSKINNELCQSIMQQLLCSEISFLRGAGLADTLFTNVFMSYPERIPNETLRVFVCATLWMANSVLNLITSAGAYEEEDFIADQKHFRLSTLPESHLIEQLLFSSSSFLKFRLFYHLSFSFMMNRAMKKARKSLIAMKCILFELKAIQPTTTDLHHLGFNPSMNRRLYVQSPPRTIKVLNWNEALKEWDALIHHLLWITQLNPEASPMLVLHQFEYATHVLRFTAMPRCLLQFIFYNHDMKFFGVCHWSHWHYLWLQEFVQTPYPYHLLVQDKIWYQFSTLTSPLSLDLFRIFTSNTARQRRLLIKLLRVSNQVLNSYEALDRELEVKYHQGDPLYSLTNWGQCLFFQSALFVIKWGFHLEFYFYFLLTTYIHHLLHLPSGPFSESSPWIRYYRSLACMAESLAVAIFYLHPVTESQFYLQRFRCFRNLPVPYFPYASIMEKLRSSSLTSAYHGFHEALKLLNQLLRLDVERHLGVDRLELSNYFRICNHNRQILEPFLSGPRLPCGIRFDTNNVFCTLVANG